MSVLFLHVPHTGGRVLKRWLKTLTPTPRVDSVHNPRELVTVRANTYENLYVILRTPYERGVAEYVHYSRSLASGNQVNHLLLETVRRGMPTFDPLQPGEYFGLEQCRNLVCKLVLRREDWKTPLTRREYHIALFLVQSGHVVWDTFSASLNPVNLARLLSREVSEMERDLSCIRETHHVSVGSDEERRRLLTDETLRERWCALNEYDVMLYKEMTGVRDP